MSANSVIESWMDDNSITEKPLRQGIAPKVEPVRRHRDFSVHTMIFLSLGIMIFSGLSGLWWGEDRANKEWEAIWYEKRDREEVETEKLFKNLEVAVLPDRLVERNLEDVEVGEIVYINRIYLRVHEDTKKLWVKITTTECYEEYAAKGASIRLERKEHGFAATLFEEKVFDPFYRFDTSTLSDYVKHNKDYLPVLSLRIRQRNVNE